MNRKKRDNIIGRIIMMLVGAVCGIFIVLSADLDAVFASGSRGIFGHFATSFILLAVAYFIQMVIHESGHLIFGLLSGYDFVSFRVANIMVIKSEGKIRIKLYNIVGTGGQCLMMPPPWKNGVPYRLYNLGGCIMNLAFAVLFIVLFALCEKGGFLSIFLGMLAATGLGNVFINGIPLEIGGISNDGKNALILGKSETTLRAFWLQLYVNGLLAFGERMKNMPGDWFFLPEGEGLCDPIVCTVGVMKYNYYFDLHDFEKAEETAEYMLKAPGLLDLHKNELLCELLFLKILKGAGEEEISAIYTRQLDRYIKATANYVSRRRLAYAYQLLFKKNVTMAAKCLELFEKTVKTYPYSSEIENEKEIIEIIRERADVF